MNEFIVCSSRLATKAQRPENAQRGSLKVRYEDLAVKGSID
jgi:hypothetical protein